MPLGRAAMSRSSASRLRRTASSSCGHHNVNPRSERAPCALLPPRLRSRGREGVAYSNGRSTSCYVKLLLIYFRRSIKISKSRGWLSAHGHDEDVAEKIVDRLHQRLRHRKQLRHRRLCTNQYRRISHGTPLVGLTTSRQSLQHPILQIRHSRWSHWGS